MNEKTNIIDVIEKNIAHGPNVEKTKCRGHGDTGGWTGRGGIKLRHKEELNFGIENCNFYVLKAEIKEVMTYRAFFSVFVAILLQ